jgi:hypothetical protein
MSAKVGFGLVRDRDGRPKIDDPSNLHPAIVAMLTPQERVDLGIWSGPMARDAQGIKRLEKLEDGYRAVDPLVAVSEIYDGPDYFKLPDRIDVPLHGVIKLEITA